MTSVRRENWGPENIVSSTQRPPSDACNAAIEDAPPRNEKCNSSSEYEDNEAHMCLSPMIWSSIWPSKRNSRVVRPVKRDISTTIDKNSIRVTAVPKGANDTGKTYSVDQPTRYPYRSRYTAGKGHRSSQ